MGSKNVVGWGGTIVTNVAGVMSAVSVDQIETIVLLVIGIVSASVSISYTLYKWYKEVMRDGKITFTEIKQGVDIVKDGVEKVENVIKGGTKDGDKNKQ